MKKNKILVTGATGFVGKAFLEHVTKVYPDLDIVGVGFNKIEDGIFSVDLTQLGEVKELINSQKPTHVFHFAAMVNPKLNEQKKLESYNKNFIITNNIVSACPKETFFYFLSTDKVYDANNRESIEEDELKYLPDNFYSLMKVICESMVKSKFDKYLIFRCPIIHSSGNLNSNSFIDAALINLKKGDNVIVYDNIVRHYILVEELVDFLSSLINTDNIGIFNVGSRAMSYFERIFSLADNLGLNTSLIQSSKGDITPLVQTYSLNKLHSFFNKFFN